MTSKLLLVVSDNASAFFGLKTLKIEKRFQQAAWFISLLCKHTNWKFHRWSGSLCACRPSWMDVDCNGVKLSKQREQFDLSFLARIKVSQVALVIVLGQIG